MSDAGGNDVCDPALARLATSAVRVDDALRAVLDERVPPQLDAPVSEAVFGAPRAPGALFDLAVAAFDDATDRLRPAAVALELVAAHRRALAAATEAEDATTAILAGDFLHALAFERLAAVDAPPADRTRAAAVVTDAATACIERGSCAPLYEAVGSLSTTLADAPESVRDAAASAGRRVGERVESDGLPAPVAAACDGRGKRRDTPGESARDALSALSTVLVERGPAVEAEADAE